MNTDWTIFSFTDAPAAVKALRMLQSLSAAELQHYTISEIPRSTNGKTIAVRIQQHLDRNFETLSQLWNTPFETIYQSRSIGKFSPETNAPVSTKFKTLRSGTCAQPSAALYAD
jgi:hypothetical protein